ncbi:MAG TPA: HNH endonuclease signature motif containing protein [Mycobacterium sp.]|nr:HNH endonuclease signature motif containing protein [Mycobacterium sp.]
MAKRKKFGDRRWRLIQAIVARDGWLCSICCYPMKRRRKSPSDDPDAATIDHRVPRSRDGNDHIDNLQLAHRRCNQQRGTDAWPGGPEAP